ncbi:hypothetical protein [Conexibacter arvalis]|uniref:Glycosyltransferase RgtA/B/C/D-like domain-containing protein n=1 Tax=Conexibacter arvalis TaxID=912552 RepID=A0A840IAZ7_9ACTN|nr:hypothetical protein [Conexibacter arvalis]MBB4661525.1 hypothetical protein [Conexibacter arvalis]
MLLVVLAIHGFLPGQLNDGPWGLLLEGDLRCLDRMGLDALRGSCDQVGVPAGYPFLTSGPFIAVGSLVMRVPGIGSYEAYLIAGGLFDALALAGGYALMRTLGAGRAVALATAGAYLVTPSIVGIGSFGGTFTGFTLLPAFAFLDIWTMRTLERAGRRGAVAVMVAYAATRVAALFLDGYSFVAAALVTAALWLPWLLRRSIDLRIRLMGAATVVGSPLIAYLLYRWYAPALVDPAPLELFRAMGLDLWTLVRPSQYLWLADGLGVSTPHAHLWGDGTNAQFNYAGFACVALAAVALGRRWRAPHVAGIAAAGAVAFVLALGPSLKVDDARPHALDISQVTYESYLMPASAADLSLPWDGAFAAVPGLEHMRAVYRWSIVTRMSMVVLAGLAVALLLRRSRLLGLAVACIAIAELAPNVPLLLDQHRARHEQRVAFANAVLPELEDATRSGERVLFRSAAPTGVDYVVNFLAASAGVRSYNAGGDKNAVHAAASRPPEVAAVAAQDAAPDTVASAFATGGLDALVLTDFDLRLAAYAWPPEPSQRSATREAFAAVIADPRFAVDRREWFTVVRSADR